MAYYKFTQTYITRKNKSYTNRTALHVNNMYTLVTHSKIPIPLPVLTKCSCTLVGYHSPWTLATSLLIWLCLQQHYTPTTQSDFNKSYANHLTEANIHTMFEYSACNVLHYSAYMNNRTVLVKTVVKLTWWLSQFIGFKIMLWWLVWENIIL